jgi:hypothetical protein
MVARLSWRFGLLSGVMWMAEVIPGNLGGTPVPGRLASAGPDLALGAVAGMAVRNQGQNFT